MSYMDCDYHNDHSGQKPIQDYTPKSFLVPSRRFAEPAQFGSQKEI
jgi:hypothetical protein